MKIIKLTVSVCVLVLSFNLLQAADAPKAPPLDLKGACILVCAGYWGGMTGMPVIRKLTGAGAEVRCVRRAELTWDTVQQYHLIIYLFDQAREKTKPGAEGPDAVLQKFVQVGGGVLFVPTEFESKDDINQSLAPFGASLLKEYLQDPRNTFTSSSGYFNLPYAYTENISTGEGQNWGRVSTYNISGHDINSSLSFALIRDSLLSRRQRLSKRRIAIPTAA